MIELTKVLIQCILYILTNKPHLIVCKYSFIFYCKFSFKEFSVNSYILTSLTLLSIIKIFLFTTLNNINKLLSTKPSCLICCYSLFT